MAVYLPVQALNRSQNIRIGTGGTAVQLVPGTTSYVDITNGAVKRDIQRHSALGAILVVGSLTGSNTDTVVATGATATASNLVITVTAGELRKRSTAVHTTIAGGTVTLSAADGTQDRTDLVWIKLSDGTLGWSKGILAASGQSVAPTSGVGTATSVSGTEVNASRTVTVASTTGIAVGQAITGTGLPANNWVTAVNSATTFTVAYAATASATNTLTLVNTVADWNWLVAATATAATGGVDVRPRS